MGMSKHRKSGVAPANHSVARLRAMEMNRKLEEERKQREGKSKNMKNSVSELFK